MALRDIVGSLGVVPAMLARRDQKKADEISRLNTENEEMRRKNEELMSAGQGAPTDSTAPQPLVRKKKGGMISSASKRADGCAKKGKTKGRML